MIITVRHQCGHLEEHEHCFSEVLLSSNRQRLGSTLCSICLSSASGDKKPEASYSQDCECPEECRRFHYVEAENEQDGYIEACSECGKVHHLSENVKRYKTRPQIKLSDLSFLKIKSANSELDKTFKPLGAKSGGAQTGVETRTSQMLSPWSRELHEKVKSNQPHWVGLKTKGADKQSVTHAYLEPEKGTNGRLTHAGDSNLSAIKKGKTREEFNDTATERRGAREGGYLQQGHIDRLKQVYKPSDLKQREWDKHLATHQAVSKALSEGAIKANMTHKEAVQAIADRIAPGIGKSYSEAENNQRLDHVSGTLSALMGGSNQMPYEPMKKKESAKDSPKSVGTLQTSAGAQNEGITEEHKRHLIEEGEGSAHRGGKYESEGGGEEETKPKEPHEMTKNEYEEAYGKPQKNTTVSGGWSPHQDAVGTAINRGIHVSNEVLADYPDLQEKQKDKESLAATRQHLRERETERTEPLIMGKDKEETPSKAEEQASAPADSANDTKESGGIKRVGEQERNTGKNADFTDKTATHTYGHETTISAAGDVGNKQKGKYAVVEADELIPSQTDSLIDNPRYDPSLQPKDRTRQSSEVQIEKIARELDFHQLGAAPSSADGAPVIGKDNMVESGNARTLAIRRAIKAHPDSYAKYKEDLTGRAGEFGIKPEQLQGIKNPVLVRVREGDMTSQERSNWADIAGKSPVSSMSSSETAKNDGKFMTESGILSKIKPDADLDATTNKDFVTAFLGHLSVNEQNDLVQANGDLSANGLRRVNDAILSAAYDDPEIISQFTESRDINIKNLGNAMREVAPKFALIKGEIAKGNLHEMDISADVAQAAKTLSFLRKKNSTVEQHLSQQGAFGKELTETSETLLRTFEQYRRSGARVAEILNTYTEAVFGAGNPKQGSMFENEAPRPLAALMASIAHVEEQHADQSRHQPEASSLFASEVPRFEAFERFGENDRFAPGAQNQKDALSKEDALTFRQTFEASYPCVPSFETEVYLSDLEHYHQALNQLEEAEQEEVNVN